MSSGTAMSPTRPRATSRLLLTLFACAALLPAARAMAIRPQFVDAAEFFSPEAQDRGDRVIRDIKQQFGRDVMVEAYPAIPQELEGAYRKKGRERFYADWSDQRFRALGVNGVHVLITRHPGRVQIAVGNVTQQQAFTLADRDELITLMIEPFRAGRFDEALLDGVQFVQRRMERNANPGGAAPEPVTTPPARRRRVRPPRAAPAGPRPSRTPTPSNRPLRPCRPPPGRQPVPRCAPSPACRKYRRRPGRGRHRPPAPLTPARLPGRSFHDPPAAARGPRGGMPVGSA